MVLRIRHIQPTVRPDGDTAREIEPRTATHARSGAKGAVARDGLHPAPRGNPANAVGVRIGHIQIAPAVHRDAVRVVKPGRRPNSVPQSCHSISRDRGYNASGSNFPNPVPKVVRHIQRVIGTTGDPAGTVEPRRRALPIGGPRHAGPGKNADGSSRSNLPNHMIVELRHEQVPAAVHHHVVWEIEGGRCAGTVGQSDATAASHGADRARAVGADAANPIVHCIRDKDIVTGANEQAERQVHLRLTVIHGIRITNRPAGGIRDRTKGSQTRGINEAQLMVASIRHNEDTSSQETQSIGFVELDGKQVAPADIARHSAAGENRYGCDWSTTGGVGSRAVRHRFAGVELDNLVRGQGAVVDTEIINGAIERLAICIET